MVRSLWVDDIRTPPNPEDFDIARTYEQAIQFLTTREYDLLCIDHDLGCFSDNGREWTGYDVVLWLAERRELGFAVPSSYRLLTNNPSGRARIIGVIERYLL